MASITVVPQTEECACGMDYKKGTSLFAAIFGGLSMICFILCGVALYQVIDYKDDTDVKEVYDILLGVVIFAMVMYGLNALGCGLVILGAKTGNRFLLIPWMVIGCILGGMAIHSLWTTIRLLMNRDVNAQPATSFFTSPAFRILVSAIVIILTFGFGRCVGKLFRQLRAEKAQRSMQHLTLVPEPQSNSHEFGVGIHQPNYPDPPPQYEPTAPQTLPSKFPPFTPTGYKQMPPTPYDV